MAQDEDKALDKKLRDILADVSNPMKVNIDKAITKIKILFADEELERFEQAEESRRKEKLRTSPQITLGELIAKLGTCMGFRRGEDELDYQAVSGVMWDDNIVTICTNNQDY